MLMILKTLFLPVSLFFVTSACTPSQPAEESTVPVYGAKPDSLDHIVGEAADAFYASTPQAVGLSIGVIHAKDIWTYHFGTIAPESGEVPTDQTIYGIASITKTFTGVLLAQAALEGHLDLHDDIRSYLEQDAYTNLELEGAHITFYDLMNHTSGLPNSLPDRPEMYPDYLEYEGDVLSWMHYIAAVYADYSRADFLEDLRAIELDAIPGAQFNYSNAAVKLAGYILEDIYNRPFEVLVDSLVLTPLAMRDTGIELEPDKEIRTVTGFDEAGQVMPPVLRAYGAAGSLKSTIVDLAQYARWHLGENEPVVALSHTPSSGQPQEPEEGYSLGLNWQMIRHEGVRRIWQDGNIPGYSSRVVLYPELDIAIVVLANQLDRSIPSRIEQMADTILESIDERTFTLMEGL